MKYKDQRVVLFLVSAVLIGIALSYAPVSFASHLPSRPVFLASPDAQGCFPETGFCIDGRIREFWEQNDGLRVFGLPITPRHEEVIQGQALQVQWFERNRLELHPENPRPYDVLLGRLGVDILEQQGRTWLPAPTGIPQAGCRFFPETGYNICGNMLRAWQANGLELDGRRGNSESESLALFGLPISEERVETLSDGNSYTVQWFERARFELHPENRSGDPSSRRYDVLFGLLGRELYDVQGGLPSPPPTRAPLIFIPGIGGTFLFNGPEENDGSLVWLDPFKALDPDDPDDHFLDPLCLDESGNPCQPDYDIRATRIIGWFRIIASNPLERRIIERVFGKDREPVEDVYGSFIAYLEEQGYVLNQDLFLFPYDWRKDLDWISTARDNGAAQSLAEMVDQVKEQTGAAQVTLIAHSMGGLIAQHYLDTGENAQNVDRLITVATPWRGTPAAIQALWVGWDYNICFWDHCLLNPIKMRELSQRFASVYTLMPTPDYYQFYDGSSEQRPFPLSGVNARGEFEPQAVARTYVDLQAITVSNPHLSRSVYDRAQAFHRQLRIAGGVSYYHLVGTTTSWQTPGTVYIRLADQSSTPCADGRCRLYDERLAAADISYVEGDGSVPLGSAIRCTTHGQPIPNTHTYQFTGDVADVGHSEIMGNPAVRQTIVAILRGETVAGDICAVP